jgi:hypothetical protein
LKPDINSVEVHPQVNHNRHPVDGVLVGAGSLWWVLVQLKIFDSCILASVMK